MMAGRTGSTIANGPNSGTDLTPAAMSSTTRTLRKIRRRQWWGRLKLRRRNERFAINRAEYRVFSQHREDGIIEYLLDAIGAGTGTFVEIGFAPDVCNCLNLALNRGFTGLFVDGSEAKCRLARDVFAQLGRPDLGVAHAFLTTADINDVIARHGMKREIDILSIDVDGNDYWFWECLHVVNPRIVVIEYNASLGAERSLTIPYDPGFVRYDKHPSGFYHGASLVALNRLGIRRGYRLVGCETTGVNAFFLRADLDAPGVDTLTPALAFRPHRGRTRYKKVDQAAQFARIAHMPFVDVAGSD